MAADDPDIMDTGDWLAIIDLLIVFKLMVCTVLGDGDVVSGGEVWDNGRQLLPMPLHIQFHPSEIKLLYMNHVRRVSINYTLAGDDQRGRPYSGDNDTAPSAVNASRQDNVSYAYFAKITSEDPRIAIPLGRNYGPADNWTRDVSLPLHANRSNVFAIKAVCIGRTSIVVEVVSFVVPSPSGYDDYESSFNASSVAATLAIVPYRVTVIRKLRLVDFIFDRTITVIAAMNSFSIGCTTELDSLRVHFRHPTSILIAACCQFIIMPIVS